MEQNKTTMKVLYIEGFFFFFLIDLILLIIYLEPRDFPNSIYSVFSYCLLYSS